MNKQQSDNVPQLAVHVFASHGLMHQDINSGLDWVKIHKMASFLVNLESCIFGTDAEFHQCNDHLNFPGQESHFP